MKYTTNSTKSVAAEATIRPQDHKRTDTAPNTPAYFRQLKMRIRFGALTVLIIPFVALSIYFHFQFTFTLKESANHNLVAITESQRNTIDLFLQERVVNIFSLFQSETFNVNPTADIMENYLRNLRRTSDAFIDVGFLNEKGIQIGYAGPYPLLQNKNYAGEEWLKNLLSKEQNYFISDIYLGFRNKAHFTIAVKQVIDDQIYIMRSTLDPDKFYMFLRTMSREKEIDAAIINRQGIYQLVDPAHGTILDLSDVRPGSESGSGVREVRVMGVPTLVSFTWLNEVPWALIVKQPVSLSYGKMLVARKVIVISTIIIFIAVALVVWVSTGIVIRKAQDNAEKREQLQLQLLHASKLASVGELATGVAHEINNPLAIVIATSNVIRDMLNPEFGLDASHDNIIKELDTIDAAVFRARNITRQLLDFGRKNPTQPVPCNLNQLMDDILGGLKQRSLELENIEIKKQYDPGLPNIVADPDQIRQVFLNLINNAGDAIKGPGMITIITDNDEKQVRVTISDTGKGMTSAEMQKIFDPFFTTKQTGKGTGLGLSIALSLVKSMGGAIEVQSMPNRGSSFTVIIPIDIEERINHAA